VKAAAPALESKSLLDKNNLDTAGGKGRVGADDLVVSKGRGGDTIGITGTGRLSGESKLVGASPGLLLVLDDLVGASKNDDMASTKGDTTDLGAREISVSELAVLGDSGNGGEVVVDGGANGAAELGLLGGVGLSEDGGVDVVPGNELVMAK